MSKPLVLITGATGHIGFRVLAQTLAAGYRARITSRSASSLSHLLTLPSITPYATAVETIEIKDPLSPHAFDTAVQDCTYIIHVASPIPNATISGSTGTHDPQRDYIDPAIHSTLNILSAAATSPTVSRIIITASVGILAPSSPTATSVGPDDLRPLPTPEQQQASHWFAYTASKILAHRRANEWVAAHNPRFDVLWVLPGYVMGANEPLTNTAAFVDRASSNGTMILYALGLDSPGGEPRSLDLVLVDDVAETHVRLLEAGGVESGERFVAQYPGVIKGYSDVDEWVRKWFPGAVEKGLLPLGGKVEGVRVGFDSRKTTEKLGVEFKGLDEMVRSLIGQYVALAKKEGKL